jgi:hypothetical protein
MPAGSRSAAQCGRKKDEIWDLVKNVEKVITKSGAATSEKRWVCKFCDRTLQGEVPTSSWRTMEFMEAARRRMSTAAGTPRQSKHKGKTTDYDPMRDRRPGQDERAACRYRAKSCAVDGVLAGG